MSNLMDFDFEEKTEEVQEARVETFSAQALTLQNAHRINPCDLHGTLRIIAFEVEADKDYLKGTTFGLCLIPQSEVRILGALSRINFNLSCKKAILGWGKFKQRRGGFVPIDLEGFGEVKSTQDVQEFLDHVPVQSIKVDSLEGVQLICTTQGKGKKGDKVDGYVVYVKT